MATLSVTHPTLADVAKVKDPNGRIDGVAEILNETNDILMDAVFLEGNLETGHRGTMRTGLPTPTWRKFNQGVQSQKATTAQVVINCGMLEALAEVDAELAELGGNVNAFRAQQDRAFIEGMNQEFASTLFYGSEDTEPEAFTGFAPHYNDLSATNAINIIDAGGTGSDNQSIYLVVWGPGKCNMRYPKASKAGLMADDLGKYMSQTATDADGNTNARMMVYGNHYKWKAGLYVEDWRYVVRICNIDRSLLTKDAASGADLVDLIAQALNLPPNLIGRPALYCSREIMSFLDRQQSNKVANATLKMAQIYGEGPMALTARGVPIRRCDALDADEARVT